MHVYRLKLFVYSFNIFIYGDTSDDKDQSGFHYLYQDLTKFGAPGTITIGAGPGEICVAAEFPNYYGPDDIDPEKLTKVEVIVDETAKRKDDVFFEYVMPIGADGLLINQVAESDTLPIVDTEDVHVPVPWVGSSTLQLIAPDGFCPHYLDNRFYYLDSLRVIVSPEIPQP